MFIFFVVDLMVYIDFVLRTCAQSTVVKVEMSNHLGSRNINSYGENSFVLRTFRFTKDLQERIKFVDRAFLPPLPHDLADLKSCIIATVKNIDARILISVCGKNLNILSMCAVSRVVHTSNICSCQKKIQFSCGYEQFH